MIMFPAVIAPRDISPAGLSILPEFSEVFVSDTPKLLTNPDERSLPAYPNYPLYQME